MATSHACTTVSSPARHRRDDHGRELLRSSPLHLRLRIVEQPPGVKPSRFNSNGYRAGDGSHRSKPTSGGAKAMTDDRAVPAQDEEGVWCVTGGDLTRLPPREVFRPDEVENLTYDNPYGMEIERVWFDGKIVFAVESGEVEIEFNEHRSAVGNKVAQEYQVVYGVELDERGQTRRRRT
jgi:hypothetical protein